MLDVDSSVCVFSYGDRSFITSQYVEQILLPMGDEMDLGALLVNAEQYKMPVQNARSVIHSQVAVRSTVWRNATSHLNLLILHQLII